MARGRKREPTSKLAARGSRLAKARAKTELPTLPPPRVALPRWLSVSAKAAWKKLVPLLQSRRLLGEEDLAALERYCVYYAEWRAACRDVSRNGHLSQESTREGHDRVVPNPSLKIMLDLGKELSRMEAKFGLSPQDRAGLSVGPHRELDTGNARAAFESPVGRKPRSTKRRR